MSKKLTYEFVKESFEAEGYTLLSKEYVNNASKLEYICPNGHKHSMTWASWQRGCRCGKCALKIRADKHRTSFDSIKASFENDGYTLLSEDYKHCKQKLCFICPNGHKSCMSLRDWNSGNRCNRCFGPMSVNIDIVRKSFEECSYTLISNVYKTAVTKLDYICPNGHTSSITWNSWNNGNRCSYCAGLHRRTVEEVHRCFEKHGYKLTSDNYVNNNTKLEYICPNGHSSSMSWANFINGRRCPICAAIGRFGKGHWNWQGGLSTQQYCEAWKDKEYKQDIKNRDGNRCLNPYCTSHNKDDLTIHHINYIKKDCRPANLITVCRSCNSKANKDRGWHKSWYQTVLRNRYNIGAINYG